MCCGGGGWSKEPAAVAYLHIHELEFSLRGSMDPSISVSFFTNKILQNEKLSGVF